MKKLERLLKRELIEYITTIRPKADAYDRVCNQLGIENNILAFVKKLTIPDVSIELPDDAIHFAEWLDIVGIRDGRFEWKYKADNYKQKYTTKEMFAEWKRILGN